jgi:hypothetical protein
MKGGHRFAVFGSADLVGDLEQIRRQPLRDEMRSRLPMRIRRDLDQISVGIAEVDGDDRSERPGARDRAFLDLDVAAAKPSLDLLGRAVRDEA